MDVPQLLHHQSHNNPSSRYVTLPNYPADHPNFPNPRHSENPRYHQQQQTQFHHQHHARHPPHQTPPFQPQPQPQPSPFKTPPPPHAYNPGQSQFSFANPTHDRPLDDGDRPSRSSTSSFLRRNLSPSQHRLSVEDVHDRRRALLRGRSPEFWDQPRVLADNPQVRALNFDAGVSQKFHSGHNKSASPYKTGNKLRLEPESSCRFRVEYGDSFEPTKHGDEMSRGAGHEGYYRRSNLVLSSGMSVREVEFVPNPSSSLRNSEPKSEIYDGRYKEELYRTGRRDGAYENQRRFYDRKVHREAPDSSFERGTIEIVNGDGSRFVSVKRDYSGTGSGRYSVGSRGDRESYHQTNRTPRKQFQKKSALLRIQMPDQRNTGNDKFGYYGYHDNSNPSSFRRRDNHAYADSEIDEEQVEGRPVCPDVSFKSNSMVAKAIVTPPHTLDDSYTGLTPRNSKGIREDVSDKDCSNVELTKPIGSIANMGGSVEAVNSPYKKTIQLEEKVTPVKYLGDGSQRITANVTGQLLVKNENPQKGRVGPAKPSPKVAKKKEVAKKIVKKVIRTRKRVVLNSEKKKDGEPLSSDACIPSQSKDSGTSKGVTTLSYPCPSEVKESGTRKKLGGTQIARESEEYGTDLNSSTSVNADDNGNKLSTELESSMQEEVRIDKSPKYEYNSSQGLLIISERNKDLATTCSSNSFPNAADVFNHIQSYQMGDSSLGDITGCAFPTSGHTELHDNRTSIFSAANTTDTTSYTANGAKLSKEETLVSEETPKAASRSSPTNNLSSSMEFSMDVHSSCREENIIPSTSATHCIIKQLCTDAASRLPKTDASKTFPLTNISTGRKKEGTSMIRKKRTVKSQLDFSRETYNNLNTTNVLKSAFAMDTTLSISSENPSCEVAVSTLGSLDDGLQPGRDAPHNSSSYGISEANLISRDDVGSALYDSSVQCSKRRKVSTFCLPPQTEEKPADRSLSCLESPSTSSDVLVQHETEYPTNSVHTSCVATNLTSCVTGITGLHDNKLAEVFSNMQSRREEEEEEVGAGVLREQDIASDETLPHTIYSAIQPSNVLGTFPCTGMRESDNQFVKGDFSNSSNYLSPSTDCSEATSIDELIDCVPDLLTSMGSPQTLSNISDVQLSVTTSVSQISHETCMEDKNLDKKSVNDSGSDISAQKSSPQCAKTHLVLDWTTVKGQKVDGNTLLALHDYQNPSEGLKVKNVEYIGRKNQHGHTISKAPHGHLPPRLATMKKKAASTNANANARTWHRSSPTSSLPGSDPVTRNVPSQKQLPGRDGKLQSTSYVRKGNSLVRNPSPSAPSQGSGFSPVYRLNSAGLDESKRSLELENRVTSNLPGLTSGEKKGSSDKPRTSLIQSGKKLPSSTAITSGDFMPSTSAGPLSSGCDGSNSDTIHLSENNDTTKLVEDSSTCEDFESQSQFSNSDNQAGLNEGNLASLNAKKIVYVKRKSNQLVATSNSVDVPVVKADKSQTSSFDGYYKRRKNQLIRTSLESNTRQPVPMSDMSGVQMTLNAASSMKLSRRRSLKVVAKTFKRSTNSVVWTCAHSTKNNIGSLNFQKVFPHLFPWKRTAYGRNFMHNWSSFSKSSSSMAIRKLLLSRQRDTVYTRSKNGFSLRKSKVLSVGGSSLKWSKSIERDSKKANEEATLAVAAVEREKREQKGVSCISSGPKTKNHSSRERIFRIGLFRYRMDPSRRTLQRISDDESSSSAPTTNFDKDAKRLYIPRRLVIGNNEYVRIGNGNKLVRDPKKRTRILASEKVRWSLHTARLRLAKKRKYCQFFTRFGRCNKDSGKCPYLHDPSKIAVCTKFLNGLCANANCRLTHKVIPERMPDCSYFLQGLCTNQSCPYRHVNVNPKASTCEGFLRGYCADGDECRKKHSYVCPDFEATGTCPRKSKCKLHHPKNRAVHGKKRKRSREQRNAGGRYFGSPDISVLESRAEIVSDKCFAQENGDVFSEGTMADYIAVGVSDDDDDTGENNNLRDTQTLFFCDRDTPSSDFEEDLADELIKPIRLMGTSQTT